MHLVIFPSSSLANVKRYSKESVDKVLPYSPDGFGTDYYTELIQLFHVNAYPSLEFEMPADDKVFTDGQNIEFSVRVYDANGPGDIQRVEFYVENKLLFTDSDSKDRYTFTWKKPMIGKYAVSAVVYDRQGFSGENHVSLIIKPHRMEN